MFTHYLPLIIFLVICVVYTIHRIKLVEDTESDPMQFYYSYYANTRYALDDHMYRFDVRKVRGKYRCYILRTPEFRGRNTSHYLPHYLTDGNEHYICWTGAIIYPEQAKTLCKNWADATQQFIDTGVPAAGFSN